MISKVRQGPPCYPGRGSSVTNPIPATTPFGLIHGLGIAGGLGPLQLPPATLALALLAFSLGLEAAQLGIAIVAAPIGTVLRATPAVSRRMLPVLSGGVALLAVLWITERAVRLADLRPTIAAISTETPHA